MKTNKAGKVMGRPKLPDGEAKGVLFAVRMAPGDAKRVNQAIKRSGTPKPEWARRALLAAADR